MNQSISSILFLFGAKSRCATCDYCYCPHRWADSFSVKRLSRQFRLLRSLFVDYRLLLNLEPMANSVERISDDIRRRHHIRRLWVCCSHDPIWPTRVEGYLTAKFHEVWTHATAEISPSPSASSSASSSSLHSSTFSQGHDPERGCLEERELNRVCEALSRVVDGIPAICDLSEFGCDRCVRPTRMGDGRRRADGEHWLGRFGGGIGEESYSLLCRLYLKDSEDGLDEAQADSVDRSSIPYRQTMEIVQLALSIGPAVFHRWRCGATTRSEYLPPTDSWPWMSWTHGIRMMVVGTRHKTSRDLLRETGPCPCSSTVAGW